MWFARGSSWRLKGRTTACLRATLAHGVEEGLRGSTLASTLVSIQGSVEGAEVTTSSHRVAVDADMVVTAALATMATTTMVATKVAIVDPMAGAMAAVGVMEAGRTPAGLITNRLRRRGTKVVTLLLQTRWLSRH
jgi:hypothetical protein